MLLKHSPETDRRRLNTLIWANAVLRDEWVIIGKPWNTEHDILAICIFCPSLQLVSNSNWWSHWKLQGDCVFQNIGTGRFGFWYVLKLLSVQFDNWLWAWFLVWFGFRSWRRYSGSSSGYSLAARVTTSRWRSFPEKPSIFVASIVRARQSNFDLSILAKKSLHFPNLAKLWQISILFNRLFQQNSTSNVWLALEDVYR